MTAKQAKYSLEEIARRGDAIYNERIRPLVEGKRDGEVVAIDVDSGDWEADPDRLAACQRLEERRPNSEIWLLRVGERAIARFGGGRRRSTDA